MGGVLLVVMPFGSLESPPIGVSTLKARLLGMEIPCDVAYLNIRFAEMVGYDLYSEMTTESGEVLAGEWLFAQTLFSPAALAPQEYVDRILLGYAGFPESKVQRILGLAGYTLPFLEHCMQTVRWAHYDIIGFTSMFEQNLACLSLAKRLKEAYPDKILVMGGANCAGGMGLQLHRSFSFLDYVFQGEADTSFPEFVRRILAKEPVEDGLPGCISRKEGASVDGGLARPIQKLDTLPYPNYDDFFEQLQTSQLPRQLVQGLMFETSRGCWWGQKRQCEFCGLDRQEIGYRSKSSGRALDEILHLTTRYGVSTLMPVDNILSMDYFATLLPELKRRRTGIRIFYETKSNLSRRQIELLMDAGITKVQPGIESFSPNVLQLMKKGVSPLYNVRYLKWCSEFGLDVFWNLLYGLPGENWKDYASVLDQVTSMAHLQPPMACGWIRLYRFSPIFEHPTRYGIFNVRPFRAYRYIYPFPEEDVSNLAYVFDFDFDGREKIHRWAYPVQQEVERWKLEYPTSRLEVIDRSEEAVTVQDTRSCRTFPQYRFGRPEKDVLDFCDDARSYSAIWQFLQKGQEGGGQVTESWLRQFLDYLVDHRLVLRDNDHYLSLILGAPRRGQVGLDRLGGQA